jgi:hypothetical protein
MATTTNYGWTTPDDTDLVKDGAAAIRTLGSSVDTTTKNLNPETTLGDIAYRSSTANVNTRLPLGTAGQVLKVNSGATAPEWSSDNAGMTNPMTTTGDTIYSSSGSTPARLAIGSTGNVLTVAGGVPTWAAPTAGGLTQLATGSLTSTSVDITSITGSYTHLQLWIYEMSANANGGFRMQFNSDTGSNYFYVQTDSRATDNDSASATTFINIQTEGNAGSSTKGTNVINIYGYSSTSIRKTLDGVYFGDRNTVGLKAGNLAGAYDSTSAITSIQIFPEPSNSFDNGTYILYGVK